MDLLHPPLPDLDHTVPAEGSSQRLVDYLKARLVVVPVSEIGDLITSGRVRIARGDSTHLGRTWESLRAGDRLLIDGSAIDRLRRSGRWNPPHVQDVRLHYEDADLLAVDKPSGMHVHPLGDRREHTLIGILVARAGAGASEPWGRWRPHVVQRLDCAVSGLLLVAKSAAVKAGLVRVQQGGGLHRRYRAMVCGVVSDESGLIDAPVGRSPLGGSRRAVVATTAGGQSARTDWRVLERRADRTLLDVEPRTGRTHQIRVHLASIGHPILGDFLYGAEPTLAGEVPAPPRLGDDGPVAPIALHACGLSLEHPTRDMHLDFQSPPPAGFGLC